MDYSPEEQEFNNFLIEQRREAIKKVIFWLVIVAGFTTLVMLGTFSFFDVVANSIAGAL